MTRRWRGLAAIADFVLSHDRAIATRVDDSVVRVMAGAPRVLRRARGFAPAAIPLPPGFAAAPDLLAAGGELKATFCLVKDGAAILSQHIGDLEDARTFDDYRKRHRALHRAVRSRADGDRRRPASRIPVVEVRARDRAAR